MKVPSHRCAFTLVEILASISVVAVLAVMAMAALTSARQAASAARCATHMRELGSALLTYGSDNGGVLPPGPLWDREIASLLGISDFKTDWPLLKCPADTRMATALSRPRSYCASAMRTPDTGIGVFSRTSTVESRRLAQIANPSQTILLCELYTTNFSGNSQFVGAFSIVDGWPAGLGPRLVDGSYYHKTGNNYLFCDGHVERLTVPELVSLGKNLWHAY